MLVEKFEFVGTEAAEPSMIQVPSTYFLKLSKIACQPPFCNSTELISSASKVSTTFVLSPSYEKMIFAFLPSPMVYSINRLLAFRWFLFQYKLSNAPRSGKHNSTTGHLDF